MFLTFVVEPTQRPMDKPTSFVSVLLAMLIVMNAVAVFAFVVERGFSSTRWMWSYHSSSTTAFFVTIAIIADALAAFVAAVFLVAKWIN